MILADLIGNLGSGFSLGLITGTACFATCGPIYMPYLIQRKLSAIQSVFMVLEISAGRFISYILFGLLAGFLGQSISSFTEHREIFTAIAYIAFSIMLFVSAFRTNQKEKGCAVKKWHKFADTPFLLGVFTGINFCPSFLIALTSAVSLDGPVSGAVLFFGFFAGTSLFLLPLSVFGILGNVKVLRTIGIAASVLIGSYFIVVAIITITHITNTSKTVISESGVVSLLDDTPLFILSSETENTETLKIVIQESRKGTVTIINEENNISDSCYVFVTTGYSDTVMASAKGMMKPSRFIIVLPEVDSTGYTTTYANSVVTYFNKYYFKSDTLHGTFFNMSSKREKKVNSSSDSTTEKSVDTASVLR